MTFKIEQVHSSRESFDEYRYNIYDDGLLVARYWHDYRGDDHGIDFINGTSEFWPVGRMVEFVEGGGPKPLMLTGRAISYIEKNLEDSLLDCVRPEADGRGFGNSISERHIYSALLWCAKVRLVICNIHLFNPDALMYSG